MISSDIQKSSLAGDESEQENEISLVLAPQVMCYLDSLPCRVDR